MENFCAYCQKESCCGCWKSRELEGCIFNLTIYESNDKVLFYNIPNKSIYLVKNQGIMEISFKEAIREIDIIPNKAPQWKRLQILNLAKDLGFFGINA